MSRNTLVISLVTAAVVWSSGAASAQYFGRNKVHYIGQCDFARPFQRDRRSWVSHFNLSPGF